MNALGYILLAIEELLWKMYISFPGVAPQNLAKAKGINAWLSIGIIGAAAAGFSFCVNLYAISLVAFPNPATDAEAEGRAFALAFIAILVVPISAVIGGLSALVIAGIARTRLDVSKAVAISVLVGLVVGLAIATGTLRYLFLSTTNSVLSP